MKAYRDKRPQILRESEAREILGDFTLQIQW